MIGSSWHLSNQGPPEDTVYYLSSMFKQSIIRQSIQPLVGFNSGNNMRKKRNSQSKSKGHRIAEYDFLREWAFRQGRGSKKDHDPPPSTQPHVRPLLICALPARSGSWMSPFHAALVALRGVSKSTSMTTIRSDASSCRTTRTGRSPSGPVDTGGVGQENNRGANPTLGLERKSGRSFATPSQEMVAANEFRRFFLNGLKRGNTVLPHSCLLASSCIRGEFVEGSRLLTPHLTKTKALF